MNRNRHGNPAPGEWGQRETCGAAADDMEANGGNTSPRPKPLNAPNIRLCPDGYYRWIYEFSMLRNPTILFTVWKVLGIGFAAAFLLSALAAFLQNHSGRWEALLQNLRIFAILALVFALISTVAYLIVAASYGWRCMVLFEMNEREVRHIQMPEQFQKAQALGWLTMMAARGPSAMGGGLLAAARDRSVSVFQNVTSITANRRRQVIYVNEMLDKNQIYASPEDFDFVLEFILSHANPLAAYQAK